MLERVNYAKGSLEMNNYCRSGCFRSKCSDPPSSQTVHVPKHHCIFILPSFLSVMLIPASKQILGILFCFPASPYYAATGKPITTRLHDSGHLYLVPHPQTTTEIKCNTLILGDNQTPITIILFFNNIFTVVL